MAQRRTKISRSDVGLLVLRVAVSILMMVHGFGKVSKILSGSWGFADPIGIGSTPTLFFAAFAEFLCMILLILGFKTRLVVIPPLVTMLVAALVVHSGDPWGDKELAVLNASIFFSLMLTGGGNISLSAVLGRRNRRVLRH